MASNEWLVRKLHEQDKKIEALSRGGTGVGHTSIAPGENLTVISDNGEVVLGAGGVEHVDGPTPATPSAPTLKLGFGTIETTWDGTFAEGEDEDGVPLTAPVDFDVVEVHCSTDPEEEEWGEDTMRGQIKTREGGTITVGGFDVDDEVFVCLIALAKTGKRSAPSATASLTIEGLDFSQLFTEIDAANATIKNAGEVLVTEQGTLDEKLTEVDGTLNDLGQDLQAVEDAQAQLNTDLTDVMTSVDGKNTITWNPSAPSKVSNPGKAAGDLWYRTSGNNIIGFWKWDGTDWVTQLLDKTTIPLIDIGAGTFGSLNGARLVAGSVAASSIAVGDFTNLATIDPVRNINVTRPSNWATETVGEFIRTKATSQDVLMFKDRTDTVPFGPGDSLRIKYRVKADAQTEVQFRLWAYPQDSNGASTGQRQITSPYVVLPPWTTNQEVVLDIPEDFGDGVIYKSWIIGLAPQPSRGTTRVLGVRDVSIYRMTGRTLIQDGAVSTQKLSADVLEVKNLKATSGQLDEAVINKLFSDVVVAKTAVAEQFIGENAILTGAVTAPKITASEELWAKIGEFVKIRAEHIEADAIDGMAITGATYRTSGGTGSWSDAGLFIAQPDGTSMVRFPTDGSPLSLTASDTQIERASIGDLDLSYGAVRSGGEFTLASGVAAPASPPELTAGWQKHCTLPRPSQPSDTNTLGYWANGDQWVRAIDVAEIGVIDRIETYDYETGQVVNSFEIGLNPRHGLTVIGDVAYVMGKDYTRPNPEVYMFGYDLNTGARVARWEYTRGIQARNALGNDGTNLIIGSVYNLELWVHRRDPVTGVQVGSDMRSGFNSWPASGGKDLYSVRISGNDVEVVTAWGGRVYLNSNNALVRKTDSANASGYAGWVLPAHDVSGYAWVSGVPYPVDSGGTVYEGSTSASDYTSELCFTWYDGTHETTASPVAVAGVPAREAVTVSLPVRAGLQKRLYSRAQGGTNWARSTVAADATVVPAPAGLALYAPPTTNSFPNADPATLKSTNNTFEVKGDGSGHWGQLQFDTDGRVRGLTVSGTVAQNNVLKDGGLVTNIVTFPTGRFSAPPAVIASADNGRVNALARNVTAEQFELRSWNFTGGDAVTNTVTWTAIGGDI